MSMSAPAAVGYQGKARTANEARSATKTVRHCLSVADWTGEMITELGGDYKSVKGGGGDLGA
jgi:hypothetical protein